MEILNDKRDDPYMMKVKSNVALELLDRAGYGPIKQVQVDKLSVHRYVTEEDIARMKERAIELGVIPGQVD